MNLKTLDRSQLIALMVLLLAVAGVGAMAYQYATAKQDQAPLTYGQDENRRERLLKALTRDMKR